MREERQGGRSNEESEKMKKMKKKMKNEKVARGRIVDHLGLVSSGVVYQMPTLFCGSIKDNIAGGNALASDDDVQAGASPLS